MQTPTEMRRLLVDVLIRRLPCTPFFLSGIGSRGAYTRASVFQKLEADGQNATLDIYEGMWHVFQQLPFPKRKSRWGSRPPSSAGISGDWW